MRWLFSAPTETAPEPARQRVAAEVLRKTRGELAQVTLRYEHAMHDLDAMIARSLKVLNDEGPEK